VHGSFIAGAYCFTNTVGSKNTSTVVLGSEEFQLVCKWSEVSQLIELHVISHSSHQVL
jgi:hypothetical protein